MTPLETKKRMVREYGVERSIEIVEEILSSSGEHKIPYWSKALEYMKGKQPKTPQPLKRWCRHCSKWLTLNNFNESKQAKVLGYKTKCKECEKV